MAKKSIIHHAALCLVLLSIAYLCFLNFGTHSSPRQILNAFFEGRKAPVRSHLEIDRFFEQIPHDGNILLRFEGFDLGKLKRSEGLVTLIYYRSVYILLPRRGFVGESKTVINRGRDIIKAGFHPNEKWLKRHNVFFVVTCVLEPGGRIQMRLNEDGILS